MSFRWRSCVLKSTREVLWKRVGSLGATENLCVHLCESILGKNSLQYCDKGIKEMQKDGKR